MSEPELQALLLAGRFEVRGSCAYTLRLAAGLQQRGIAARIVTPDARQVDAPARVRLGIQELRRLDTPLWGEIAARFLLRDLRREPPHLIHVQSQRVARFGAWLARRLDRPYILTIHKHLDEGARL